MQVFNNVHELIGNTPIVELSQFPLRAGVRLFAKLEFLNPGGSVKDRLGLELIKAVESFKKEELLLSQRQEIPALG